jgi:hypothetical protein
MKIALPSIATVPVARLEAAGVGWGVGRRPSVVAERRPGSTADPAGLARRATRPGTGSGVSIVVGVPSTSLALSAGLRRNSTPHPSHRRGQPRVRVPHAGQRPGGAASSSPTAIGPSATPKRNQAAQERPRWTASQLASGAKTIPETTSAMTGRGNRTRLLLRRLPARANGRRHRPHAQATESAQNGASRQLRIRPDAAQARVCKEKVIEPFTRS